MRSAYSAHASSAQRGSLAASATTCSLATSGLLGGLLRTGTVYAHGLAAPDFLQVVEVAHRRVHDVHDDVAQIDQHPLAVRFALDAVDARAVFAHFLLHVVGERLHLPSGVAARDDDTFEHRGHARGVVDQDVAAFDVFQRGDHDTLLLAD